MFERFTVSAREVVVRAREEARTAKAPLIGTEHLLLALLDDRAVTAYPVLTAAGLTAAGVRAQVARLVRPPAGELTDEDAAALRTIGIDLDAVLAHIGESFGQEAMTPAAEQGGRRWGRRTSSANRFTPRARKAMGLALREAIRHNAKFIDDGYILLGVLRSDGLAAKIIHDAGVGFDQLRSQIETSRGAAA